MKLVGTTFETQVTLQAVASRPVKFDAKECNEDENFAWVQGETGQVHSREIIHKFLNKQKQSLAHRDYMSWRASMKRKVSNTYLVRHIPHTSTYRRF